MLQENTALIVIVIIHLLTIDLIKKKRNEKNPYVENIYKTKKREIKRKKKYINKYRT